MGREDRERGGMALPMPRVASPNTGGIVIAKRRRQKRWGRSASSEWSLVPLRLSNHLSPMRLTQRSTHALQMAPTRSNWRDSEAGNFHLKARVEVLRQTLRQSILSSVGLGRLIFITNLPQCQNGNVSKGPLHPLKPLVRGYVLAQFLVERELNSGTRRRKPDEVQRAMAS